ncbi:GNAT family N-acetyltransferase [Pseudoalteromonas sp.]|uniref:GNAT family N-acetyltransferase n=1 Tax=Pseudoalteromonas sp. TaxID=53249 RepID=UPI003569E72F
MVFETSRLILRPLLHSDFDFFAYLHQLPDVMRFVSDLPSIEKIQERFYERIGDWQKEHNSWLTLTMIEKSNFELIGVTGFLSQWQPFQQAELGFLIDSKFQGLGYGKESTFKIIDFAFNNCSYHKVTATVTEGNEASRNLLTSLGFQLEGRLRDNYQINGQWCHDLKFSLLRHEYFALTR